MKLYWAPQSRSLRALWLLEEAGVPYERVLVDIRNGEQATQEFRAINPMMKVPALVDGDVKVAESGAIYAYVAERCPEARLAPPVGDPRRGDYLRWLFFAAGCIEAAITEKFTGIQMPASTAGWGSFDRVVDVLEQATSQARPWLLGADFSAADVAIGSDLNFGMAQFKILPERPAMVAYLERCRARPAFQRAQAINVAGA
ncbi:glutathione S-transferase family protein [Prosthecomicrobium sp. N25]|uniref:glutathione S-transferase family protein n=1 Tax=Prosthecomicrobium sp. N25 TaxID=3129254 RepID=UPI0030785E15